MARRFFSRIVPPKEYRQVRPPSDGAMRFEDSGYILPIEWKIAVNKPLWLDCLSVGAPTPVIENLRIIKINPAERIRTVFGIDDCYGFHWHHSFPACAYVGFTGTSMAETR